MEMFLLFIGPRVNLGFFGNGSSVGWIIVDLGLTTREICSAIWERLNEKDILLTQSLNRGNGLTRKQRQMVRVYQISVKCNLVT